MTATLNPTAEAPSAVTRPRRLDERRLAGIGAIGFATLVITTNILQGATPALDASAEDVVTYLTDNRAQNVFATVAFALGAPFLLAFASAFYGRLKAAGREEDRVWARMGMIGAFLIFPTFGFVVVNRLVLLVGTDEIIATPELVTLVWRFEMAAFLINTLPIAVAILGFGTAGARAGLLPSWFRIWSPIAALVGVLAAATAIVGLEGSPTGFAGIVPFATWMVLLLTAGVRQLRSA
jgi:hypothetical protein